MATDDKSSDAAVPAVKGTNDAISGAFGFLGGTDPQFKQHAGVYGESGQLGVVGHAKVGGAATGVIGTGVFGSSSGPGFGVRGEVSGGNAGVQGHSFGSGAGVGVEGISAGGEGVVGRNTAPTGLSRAGVRGLSTLGPGVEGFSDAGNGVEGSLNRGDLFTNGALGATDPVFKQHVGVFGTTAERGGQGVGGPTAPGTPDDATTSLGFLGGRDPVFQQRAGVFGVSDQQGVMGLTTAPKGTGVYGGGTTAAAGDQIGVRGETVTGVGVFGRSFGSGAGVHGLSATNGVVGQTSSDTDAGVNGGNDGKGFGVFGGSVGGSGVEGHSTHGSGVVGFSEHGLAGKFNGNVEVTGNLNMSSSTSDITLGDVAEGFSAPDGETIQPGTVVVLDRDGLVQVAATAYDKKVAGVISGAGNYRPAIVLDKQSSQVDRLPVALMGKVFCKVDAHYAPIEVGDLLTTSNTPGHAMKATDPLKAFGSVIGKALRALDAGQGIIPILIALH